jgi:alpha-galactosidase
VTARIAIVGAGSVSFTRTLVSDLFQQPATRDCDLSLFDVDAEALEAARRLVLEMSEEAKARGRVRAAGDLRDCVRSADYVICTILVGGRAAAVRDFEITGRYGLRYTVGDTLGVAGIGRALRTIPALVEIARACQDVAPGGLLLNYTNPMGMLVSAVGRSVGYPTVGLCHSADYTVRALAGYLGVPSPELRWWSAGINHLAWILELTHRGEDCYPALARAAGRPEVYAEDRVRFELMKRVGYFVTESSKHVAEYLAFFIDKPDEIERLQIPVGEFLTRRPVPIAAQLEQERGSGHSWLRPMSNEYAPALIASREAASDWSFQANVMNDGSIDDLSTGMCVEVPCLVTRGRLAPARVGRLPAAVAGLTRQSLTVQELAVEGVLRGDRDLILQAVMMDPQASATLTLASMARLLDELLEASPGLVRFSSHRLAMFDAVPD